MSIKIEDLFKDGILNKDRKDILKSANKAAIAMYRDRYSPKLRENWDKPVEELTIEDVERDVIEAILKKYHGYKDD